MGIPHKQLDACSPLETDQNKSPQLLAPATCDHNSVGRRIRQENEQPSCVYFPMFPGYCVNDEDASNRIYDGDNDDDDDSHSIWILNSINLLWYT